MKVWWKYNGSKINNLERQTSFYGSDPNAFLCFGWGLPALPHLDFRVARMTPAVGRGREIRTPETSRSQSECSTRLS